MAFLLGGAAYRIFSPSDARQSLQRALDAHSQLQTYLSGHLKGINSLVFSPDGKTLTSASDDQTVILWDVASRKPLGKPLKGHRGGVDSVALSPNGKALASASRGRDRHPVGHRRDLLAAPCLCHRQS